MERKRGWGRAAKKRESYTFLYCTHVYFFISCISGVPMCTIHIRKTKITSCMAMARQHARPSHKHCKACAKHAHAPPPRARTRLRDFHPVEFSHRPVPVSSQTTSRNNRVTVPVKPQGTELQKSQIVLNHVLNSRLTCYFSTRLLARACWVNSSTI
jgi:hypothetical protein